MNKIIITLLAGACCAVSSAALTEAEIDSRVSDLLGRMTLAEKVGQLNQRSGFGYADEMVGLVRSGGVGSILN
nr:hypothetical protein [Muribaculaceae bacterium]